MKKIILPLILISGIVAITSCSHNSKGGNETENDSAFYPITPYIIQQTKVLDSALLAIVHYRTEKGKTDTSVYDKTAFHEIAKEFTSPDLNDPAVKSKFTEDAFADATLGTITFTYTSNDPNFPLWKASVLLNKDDMRVIYVYMEKQLISNDSTVLKKMIWKTDSNCQISSIVKKNGQPDRDIIERFVWDDSKH